MVSPSRRHNIIALFLIGLCAGQTGCAALLTPAPVAIVTPAIHVSTAQLTTPRGCQLTYQRYTPAQSIDTTVIIIPGFLRHYTHMSGLAQYLARGGIPVINMNMCQQWWRANHHANAQDVLALKRALQLRTVIYIGFSSGGLTALLAAAADANSRGVITLDLVDYADLGVTAARQLNKPFIGWQGAPSRCNAQGNGARVFTAAPRAWLWQLPGAGHCAFESPTDWWCTALCPAPIENEQTRWRAVILANTRLAVMQLVSLSPRPAGRGVGVRGETRCQRPNQSVTKSIKSLCNSIGAVSVGEFFPHSVLSR